MTDMSTLFDVHPWPHQLAGVEQSIASIEHGCHCCVTSPTGSGKTKMIIALLRWAKQNNLKAMLYTNRIMLIEQTMRVLDEHDIYYGVISSKHWKKRADLRSIQIGMIQTVNARMFRGDKKLPPADLVIVDEAHQQANGVNAEIISEHQARGAITVGFTATPLGVSHLYRHLIIAATNSQCRDCGALVPAIMYAPDELDCSKIKLTATGEYNYEDIKKYVWTPAIVGRVYEQWKKLNPDAKPAVCFAPGVAESKWFVEQMAKRGVRCAHIDGEDTYVDGEEAPSNPERRLQIVEEWKAGKIKIIFNRFVLREGIDFPWMYHLILATPIGSLTSFVQTVGRVLRRSPETPDHVIITDHGGNYYRHPHPNSDYDWSHWYFQDPSIPSRLKYDKMRNGEEQPEIACPQCGLVRASGRSCPPPPLGCGHYMEKRQRWVLQHNGQLRPVYGSPVPVRVVREKPDTYQIWRRIYYRMRNAQRSFSQAEGLFVYENGYWPPRDLPLMPRDSISWFRRIDRVDKSELITDDEHISIRQQKGQHPCQSVLKSKTNPQTLLY